ncbi:unnamed protein product, partial [Ascophyllum nodosum]
LRCGKNVVFAQVLYFFERSLPTSVWNPGASSFRKKHRLPPGKFTEDLTVTLVCRIRAPIFAVLTAVYTAIFVVEFSPRSKSALLRFPSTLQLLLSTDFTLTFILPHVTFSPRRLSISIGD